MQRPWSRSPRAARTRAAVVLALTALAAGCASIPRTHFYVLGEEARRPAAEPAADGLDVAVRSFRVDPPYDQGKVVYRLGEDASEVAFYAYHRWAAPLSQMLPRAVAFSLAGTPGVRSIEPLVPGRRYDGALEGRLVALEEVDLPGGQLVRLKLDLSLTLENGTTAWRETIDARRSVQAGDAGSIVRTMNALLDEALSEARDGIAEALREGSSG